MEQHTNSSPIFPCPTPTLNPNTPRDSHQLLEILHNSYLTLAELIAELEQRFMSHMTSKIIQQRHPMIARDFIHQHEATLVEKAHILRSLYRAKQQIAFLAAQEEEYQLARQNEAIGGALYQQYLREEEWRDAYKEYQEQWISRSLQLSSIATTQTPTNEQCPSTPTPMHPGLPPTQLPDQTTH